MTEITENLIKQLEQLSTENHLPFEKRMIDTAVWFHRNKDRIPPENIKARMDFLEKTLDIYLEMMAMALDRMQMAEGRKGSTDLWLPNGMVDFDTGKRYG